MGLSLSDKDRPNDEIVGKPLETMLEAGRDEQRVARGEPATVGPGHQLAGPLDDNVDLVLFVGPLWVFASRGIDYGPQRAALESGSVALSIRSRQTRQQLLDAKMDDGILIVHLAASHALCTEIVDDFACSIQAGCARHAAARMSAGATQVQPLYRGPVSSAAQQRPERHQLVE